jgi:hypothetical protein
MREYRWKPIEPLSDAERSIDLADIQPLYESWRAAKQRLQQSSPEGLQRFAAQLVRRLSIETGILERLYDLDRGTTEALVTAGFIEDLVARSSTDIEPARLITILSDQEAGIKLVMDCVTQNRALTKGVIHELHATLTRHQETTIAVDQFGKRFEIPLLHGAFKKLPNNPSRPDGVIHEYCPPEHADSEIEKLVGWLGEYRDEDPLIVAAWVHHRFTQIHPYQDGNGRVARVLTTLVLLQAALLPLVIDRDMRTDYIDCLEKADFGDLGPLATQFARLERNAILQALSIDIDSEISAARSLTSAVIESLTAKFSKRREERHAEFRRVNQLAESLRGRARRQIERAFTQLKDPVSFVGTPEIHVAEGGPDRGNAHWYKFEVVKSGEASAKYVNFAEAHYFIKGTIRAGRERLIFVISFHHVGRELSGIMEATAFARLESYEHSDERELVSDDFSPTSLEPFVITWKTRENEIVAAFERWLDTSLAIAIKEFGDRL